MPSPLVNNLRDTVLPVVENAGYELVDVEWKHEQVGWVCRVFIDVLEGATARAISHTDCERVSREVSATLDVHEVVPHAFHLEVSSPGLDRPLRTAAHFRRFTGRKARVRLRQGVEGRRNFAGLILRVVAEGDATVPETVILDVDGQEHALPLTDVDKANLVFEFPA
jgi:ribosome maturation factor RimP